MKKLIIILTMVPLMAAPLFSFGQYFQHLYDIDSSNDWGVDVFVQPDSSYLIFGTSAFPTHWVYCNVNISKSGDSMISKKVLKYDNLNLYMGWSGATKRLPDGGFLAPLNKYLYYGSNEREWGGLIRYNSEGDTVFLKTYTDTPTYYGGMFTCTVLPDGNYLAGGEQGLYTDSWPPGLIVKTDSTGDTIWTRTYQYNSHQYVAINNIIPLTGGRLAVGAYSARNVGGVGGYYDNDPWYMILDSMGNIIRDTVYNAFYQSSGFLYKDNNDGYFTVGSLDKYNENPDPSKSFPCFIAHLDTNFRTTWQTVFPFDSINADRVPRYALQMNDGTYVVVGEQWYDNGNWVNGWAAKISKTGEIVWNRYYNAGDTAKDVAFLRGAVEKPDGSGGLILVGSSHNDTLPNWWTNENLWIIGVDSNGCENQFCAPTKVVDPVVKADASVSVYPNPTTDEVIVSTHRVAERIVLLNNTGQIVHEQKVLGLQNSLKLGALPAGVYNLLVEYSDGSLYRLPVVKYE